MSERYILTDASALVQQLRDDIPRFSHNPSLIVQRKMELLEAATFGEIDVVDATNPFMHLVTSGAIVSSAILAEMQHINRKMYPYSAQRLQELLPHMSDKDFTDLFAMPDRAEFYFIYSKQEILNNMVQVEGTGVRKLVIPRNTMVKALETFYSLEYPIEIRQMNHSGIQVVWDMDKKAPFALFESNQIEHNFVVDPVSKEELLIFKVELSQFSIRTVNEVVNEATETLISASFTDEFCRARVWVEQEDGSWLEINTTYTDVVYPINSPTAVVRVVGSVCEVSIPQIYISNGLIAAGSKLRVDIYQTKGPIGQTLASYSRENFTIEYKAIDAADRHIYQAPMPALSTAIVFSEDISHSGRRAMTFAEVQERVITNAIGNPTLPITPVQAAGMLVTNGYQVIQKQDALTGRIYLATKRLPAPRDPGLITTASGGIHTLLSSLDAMAGRYGVVSNEQSITLTPDVLYRVPGTGAQIVDTSEVTTLLALPRDQFAIAVSKGNYFYSPFHYVLDNSDVRALDCRAYYLDAPKIMLRSFKGENDTTLLQVGVGEARIERSERGYKLYIQTKSSEEYKALLDTEINVQLAFASDASGKLTYLNGVLTGKTQDGERIFEFDIRTSYHVSAEDKLELTSFQMITQSEQRHFANLTEDFSILFSTTMSMPAGHVKNDVDAMLGTHILPSGSFGITHESIRLHFGTALKNLWSKCRTAVDGAEYEKYDMDVPLRYTEDQYELDPVTGSPFKIVGGNIVRNKIASRGDVVKDKNGNPVIAHYKGEVVLENGQPVIARSRRTVNIIDLFLIEGVYRFADNEISVGYRQDLVNTLVSWISRDLASIEKRTLERTEVFFYPVHATGGINVMYGEGSRTQLSATQSFTLRLYVNDQIYRNTQIRAELERASIAVLEKELSKRTISISSITKALEAVYGEDVISFEVSKLGDDALSMVTVLDEGRSLSLHKVLQLRSDDSLAVREDVTIEFRRHQL